MDFISKISDPSSGLPHPSSTLARLFRHIGRALSGLLSRQQTLLSLILLAPSVHAKALDHPTNIPSTALSYAYWIQALHNKRVALASVSAPPIPAPHTAYIFKLWPCPYEQRPQHTLPISSPATLLLACFLCTSSLALFTHARRNDPYQSYIIAFCAAVATIVGAMRTVDIENLIFIHLFWGCVIGAGGSAVLHHVIEKRGSNTGNLTGTVAGAA